MTNLILTFFSSLPGKGSGNWPKQAKEAAAHLFTFRDKCIQKSDKSTEVFWRGGWSGGGKTAGEMWLGSQAALTAGTSEARHFPGTGKWHLCGH